MTPWTRLAALCVVFALCRADQPYKFMPPMPLPVDLFSAAPKAEAEAVAVAEGRSGEAAPVEEEVSTLMSSTLAAPEQLPEAKKLVDTRSRSRKKVEAEEKVTAEPKAEDRMSNHKEEKVEGKMLPPKAEALRGRLPPRPEDEYYYYYDDEYYYDDYPEYTKPAPAKEEKYPNFPVRSSQSKPNSSKPTKDEKKESRPKSSLSPPRDMKYKDEKSPPRDTKYKDEKSPLRDTKYRDEKSPAKDPRPKSSKPKSSKPSEWRPEMNIAPRRKEEEYSIHSTLDRLRGIRENQVKRAGKPAGPSPWERFNLFSSFKAADNRTPPEASFPEERKNRPRNRKPVRPYSDYYSDDYYVDLPPPVVPEWRRQSGGRGTNPLALLVAPLAGIALLTAAAAVAINPVLVTVSLTGKRRKRGAEAEEGISPELEEKIHEMQVLEKFMSTIPDNINYQHQVLSMYLSCSGYTEVGNSCLDRVVCEYAKLDSSIDQEERDVISIVLYNIMSNEFVPAEYKERLRMAAKHGRDEGTCMVYECEELSDVKTNDL